MNDAFIFAIIWFIEGDYGKIFFEEAKAQIIALRAYLIPFKAFTYIWVGGASINPKKLPRYPSDKLVIMEISKKIELAYEKRLFDEAKA